MTLATTTPRTSVVGTNAVITVPVDFQFFAVGDLVVIERTIATGAEAVKTYGTDYTVSGGAGATGSVTSAAAVASTVEWHVRRATDRAQSNDYPTAGTFPAESHEGALDRLKAQVQELDVTIAQCLRFPRTDAAVRVAQLVSSIARANKVLSFDANGDATVGDLSASIATTTLLVVSAVDPGHATGRLWVDTSVANTLIVKQSDGADWIETWRINTTTNVITIAGAAMLALANVFTADQEIKSTTAGAGEGPTLTLNRDKTGVDGDLLGVLRFRAKDDAGGVDDVAKIRAKWVDSGAGSEDSEIEIDTYVAGAPARRVTVGQGVQIGSPTGGEPGVGKVNATDYQINGVSVNTLIGSIESSKNLIINGNFDVWQRANGATASVGARTFVADRIYVNPSGASVFYTRTAPGPDSKSFWVADIDGAASVTTVLIGTRLAGPPVSAGSQRWATTVTFSCYLQNLSGAAFTPDLLLGTPAAYNDFTTVTNRLTQALQSCVDGAWTRVTHSADISGFTNINNGLQVELRIPSGSLVAGDQLRLAQMQLEPAPSFTGFESTDYDRVLARCQKFYWKSFPQEVQPGTGVGLPGAVRGIAGLAGAVASRFFVRWPVPMVKAPVLTLYNPSAANAQVRNVTDGADHTASGIVGDADQAVITSTGLAGTAIGEELAVHITADAEL